MHYKTAKANTPEQTEQRRLLRNNATNAEAILWKALKGRGANGWKFRRQHGIGPYILDFYCPELKLCIEIDGSSHDNKYTQDINRTSYLNMQGIRVVRFDNSQVLANPEWVVSEIVKTGKEICSEGSVHI
jgi:very-short-patch-repair endonuclease